MNRSKDSIDDDMDVRRPGKTWVSSRYMIVHDKRRCLFANCGKEYARGTSHIMLKKHYQNVHGDRETVIRHRSTAENQAITAKKKSPKKRPLSNKSAANISPSMLINSAMKGNKSSIDDRGMLDVKHVARRLREATSIHLTFEIHASKKGNKTFGIITAHSLGDNQDVRSVLLEYKHLPFPDDANTIVDFLKGCIIKFNIREKIVSIASNCTELTDGEIVNELDRRLKLSKNFNFSTIQIKCFPLFVHLNVMDVFKTQENLIDGIRKVVGFVNNSNFTISPTQDATVNNQNSGNNSVDKSGADEQGSKATRLKLSCDNRASWNTTYAMIDNFSKNREIIEPILVYYENSQNSQTVKIDWDRIFALKSLLKPFYEVINKFASDNYSPVSLVAACIPHLMDHLATSHWVFEDLALAAQNFMLQLESYRQQFQSDLTVSAGLLDPRIKDTFLSVDGRDSAIDILRKLVDRSKAISPPNEESSIFSTIFKPHFEDEVLDYLESPRVSGHMDVVTFWEASKSAYPNLHGLARALLCVQASSVPNDRMFSAAENIERERRMQMGGTNAKELRKSWAKYLER